MKELETLKEMLCKGWEEMRKSKKKTTPRFGTEMFLLHCIIQCNKVFNQLKKERGKHEER